MIIVRVLFGNKCLLLLDHETLRNSVYFKRSNVVNFCSKINKQEGYGLQIKVPVNNNNMKKQRKDNKKKRSE